VPNLDVAGRRLVEAVDAAFGWTGRTRASNDADCSALAELHLGAGRGADHLLYLTGTVGIGAGMVEGRRLLRGARGFAGEVGHLPIGDATSSCGCGRTGCWEASVGLHALLAAVGLPESGTPQETAAMVARVAESSSEVRDGIASVGRWLGSGLAIVTGILDPGTIVLGGYFVPLGELIVEPATTELARSLASSELGCPDLRLGQLGTGSAASGAAERALEEAFAGAVDLLV
jgi:predicted NBD/HSP70 family sugar kinase